MDNKQRIFAKLPKVDETLRDQRLFEIFEDMPRELAVEAVREAIEEERKKMHKACESNVEIQFDEESFFKKVAEIIKQKKHFNLIRVVNATGVVLHTNLGRAVLSSAACENIIKTVKGYSNLEYAVKKRRQRLTSQPCGKPNLQNNRG